MKPDPKDPTDPGWRSASWRVHRIGRLEMLLRRYLDDHNRAAKTAGLSTRCGCDMCGETREYLDGHRDPRTGQLERPLSEPQPEL